MRPRAFIESDSTPSHPSDGAEPTDDTNGYAGPNSVTWRIAREYVVLLGAGRAVLMQLAHPLVAAGVLQHSSFLRDPLGRSYRTVEFTQILAFGSRDEAHAIARHVNRLHKGVVGALGETAGHYSAEARYRAQDPDLLLWVHATLVDSALAIYPLLVGPLSRAEQHQYYEETRRMALLLGLPREMLPASLDDFEAYVHAMLTGSALAVTPAARVLARQLLYLPVPCSRAARSALGRATHHRIPTATAARTVQLHLGTGASARLCGGHDGHPPSVAPGATASALYALGAARDGSCAARLADGRVVIEGAF